LDPQQLAAHPLRLGLSMSTDVAIRDQSGPVLASAPPVKPLLTTQAYAKQLADADALIDKTVRSNLGQGSR
jgi:membrane fusion protein (multidrug efflux system)